MADGTRCPRCREEIAAPELGASRVTCPFCDLPMVWLRRPQGPAEEVAAAAVRQMGESACFFHPENTAANICPDCGRYICNLCTVAADGRDFCPSCFDAAHQQQELSEFRDRDTLYDSMALAAGWGWVLIYPFWIVALPVVAYWTIAKSSAPRHYVVPRRPWRYAVAMLGVLALPVLLVLGLVSMSFYLRGPS